MADGALRKPTFWLRFFQMVFAIVAFACVAEWADSSRIAYTVFTGVTSMLISIVFMTVDFVDRKVPVTLALWVDGLWWCLWLVAAALLSDILAAGYTGSRLEASVAFAWLAWFSFWVTLYLDWREKKSGGTSAAPAPPTAPAV